MARIRTIKPDFFTSLTIADLTSEQRLTFIGLWTHVDDEGRCVDDPRLIKAAIWPLDDRNSADIEIDLKALSESSLITRYTLNRKRYLAVTNWFEHQRINRPTASKLPAPGDGEPSPPNPSPTRGSGTSLNAHGEGSESSNAQQTGTREASNLGAPSNSGGPIPFGLENEPSDDGLSVDECPVTWDDVEETGHSMSTHEQLTEHSRQERKGKEQGREQGTGREGAGGRALESANGKLPAVRRPDGLTIIPDDFHLNDTMRRWVAGTFPSLDADFETKQFISHFRAEGRRKRNWHEAWQKWIRDSAQYASKRRASGGNVVQLPTGQTLTGTDATVAGWAALAASLDDEESA
ncbi:hypothetical protein [Streptomyces sp. NBC_00987]|uniref:hypothetical protein n=1 Tax=Streptomyces sp. NBC_00987 TaxID=2903703 RepID=UPI00386370EA|nr:hypothetical protein OG355_33370 [Streptomyces sp. NBC_00987]